VIGRSGGDKIGSEGAPRRAGRGPNGPFRKRGLRARRSERRSETCGRRPVAVEGEEGDELDRAGARLAVELVDEVGLLAKDPHLDRPGRDERTSRIGTALARADPPAPSASGAELNPIPARTTQNPPSKTAWPRRVDAGVRELSIAPPSGTRASTERSARAQVFGRRGSRRPGHCAVVSAASRPSRRRRQKRRGARAPRRSPGGR
jgi:hypothetical protein